MGFVKLFLIKNIYYAFQKYNYWNAIFGNYTYFKPQPILYFR
ncbi:hypothetical protein ADICYQ_2871 [Cyclobacterium qasimii M12-11B]|uniref:Uncharacterized protein n=1 Tax=Cyclobacterium qasimii M12-11B TaxID=641524 RepID=S7VDR9_9BACT|nr:hypothetical protein ADICYQ_2871 [Cyclobacterium qasimii M12-11B]